MAFFERRHSEEVFSGDLKSPVVVDANFDKAREFGLGRRDLQTLAHLTLGRTDSKDISRELHIPVHVVLRSIRTLGRAFEETDPVQIADAATREGLLHIKPLH